MNRKGKGKKKKKPSCLHEIVIGGEEKLIW